MNILDKMLTKNEYQSPIYTKTFDEKLCKKIVKKNSDVGKELFGWNKM